MAKLDPKLDTCRYMAQYQVLPEEEQQPIRRLRISLCVIPGSHREAGPEVRYCRRSFLRRQMTLRQMMYRIICEKRQPHRQSALIWHICRRAVHTQWQKFSKHRPLPQFCDTLQL